MAFSETERFFGPSSPLRRSAEEGGPAYEPRQQQCEMAREVARALDENATLCVEAPTGIGKTFAYLIPAWHHARETGHPVVISTHTINLQEQITRRDVPLLSRLVGEEITCRLAKGRANYLCLHRLHLFRGERAPHLPIKGLPEFLDWADGTESGDRSEAPQTATTMRLWPDLNCERDNCIGKACTYRHRCFLFRARRALADAQLIVSNHAFLLNALDEGDSALLPEFSAVVIDEGHTLPDIAAEQLGIHPGTADLRRMLTHLLRENSDGGLLAPPLGKNAAAIAAQLRAALTDYLPRLVDFIHTNAGRNSTTLRLLAPQQEDSTFAAPVGRLAAELKRLRDNCKADDPERADPLGDMASHLQEFATQIAQFFAHQDNTWAHWFELAGRDNRDVRFQAVPVNPAPLLRARLFARTEPIPVVVTSATLAIRGTLDYFRSRIGAEHARCLVLDSPFDFQSQVTLHVPDMPMPDEEGFQDALDRQIRHYLALTEGHAFVLFTSHQLLQNTAHDLAPALKADGYTLICQDGTVAPPRLLDEFRHARNAVLFGTDSFWTGVDIPGDDLRSVIITRLPFPQLGHPIQVTREELCRANGTSFFREHMLPEAILKLRQGFGRLIRTRTDHGIIVLLDGRITKKQYGKIFLDALPKCGDGLS